MYKVKRGLFKKGFLILITSLACSAPLKENSPVHPELTFAVGSCNQTAQPQVMWGPIVKNNPDIFIWLGDIVYADTHDMSVMKSKYDQLAAEPGYQKLVETTKQIIGVWDDHDYGWNDAGKNYYQKDSSKLLLVDFLGLDDDDPVRSRQGLYSSYIYGSHPVETKVILLDGRYFRDTLIASTDLSKRYTFNPEGDMLGEAQWIWLENELENSNSDIHIIGSGVQVIPEEHGWEKWANFPKSRNRLFSLLARTKPKNPLLITGDRHIAEFSKLELDDGYSLIEMTTSGLTHTWSEAWEESNKYRMGEMVVKKNFGIIKVYSDKMLLEVHGELDSLFKSLEVPLN